jgi:hypothetical protein
MLRYWASHCAGGEMKAFPDYDSEMQGSLFIIYNYIPEIHKM